jgi:hypothetical protein
VRFYLKSGRNAKDTFRHFVLQNNRALTQDQKRIFFKGEGAGIFKDLFLSAWICALMNPYFVAR